MKLPHLDQLVPLERGEAGVLARAVAVLVRDVTHAETPVSGLQLLTLAPLASLARRLHQLHQREQLRPLRPLRPGRRPRPHQLRVSGYQLVALLHCRAALAYCGLSEEDSLLLPGIVGKFQQKSLNLTAYLHF